MVKEHKLFPTLILQINNFLSKKQCDEISSLFNKDKNLFDTHQVLKGDKNISSFNKTDDILFKIKGLNNKILQKSNEYSKRSGFYLINKITNSWFNIEEKGSGLKRHSHPNSILSGVIYIQCDSNSHPLYFYNPNPFVTYSKTNTSTDYSYEWIKFSPKQGDMLIFPSWLQHGSDDEINLSNNRTVISFNII